MPIIFTTLDDPSATLNDPILVKGTAARGINGTGQIVGLFSDNNSRPNHGFLFSGGSFTTLDDPSASTITDAFGINDAGQIVGFFNNASGIHGFLLSGSNTSPLSTIPQPPITPRCTASTTQVRSSGNTRTPPAPPTVSC